jgi:plastocyanin
MTDVTRRAVLLTAAAASVAATMPAAAATQAVNIEGMKFVPADLTVAVGDSVTFTNLGGAPHTATADAGGFDTGRLTKGQSATVTFSTAGDFPYHCAVHPGMKAVIRVA